MAARQRPISPHLQVYRWQVQMMTSILHRATGGILSLGALIFVWGLVALARGEQAWTSFAHCMASPLGWLVMFGWVWAFSFHLINGIRHLAQDGGLGFSIPDFVRNSWVAVIGSLVLTVAIFAIALMGSHGGAA